MPRVETNVKSDETVQFFRTSAYYHAASQEWHVPIHAWVYEPEPSSMRMTAFRTVLEQKYGLRLQPMHADLFRRRVDLLIADSERGKRLTFRIAGQLHVLPKTDPRGHAHITIPLSASTVEKFRVGDLLPYLLVIDDADERLFMGEVLLVPPDGVSVISDIDDTVKITGVTSKKSLMDYTFFQPFVEVPEMPALYQNFADQGIPVHFVSSSPWQLYSPLNTFLLDAGFPPASFSLKTVRFRDRSLLNLFKSGEITKPIAIEAILEKYPGRKFILIGDSGEQDPEVYDLIAQNYPEQVLAVFIRNVTDQELLDPRYAKMLADLGPDKFFVFDDPEEVGAVLFGVGVLADRSS